MKKSEIYLKMKDLSNILIRIIFILISLNSIYTINLTAQVESESKYGAYLHYNLNFHRSDFRDLPNVPNCCPSFMGGSGNGISLGLAYYHKFNETLFSQLKLGYINLNGNFKSLEHTVLSLNGVGVNGEFEHNLDVNIGMIMLEHLFTYKYKGFSFSFGITGGITVLRDFSQIEIITKPDGLVTFLDENGINTGKFTRNDIKGKIQSINSFNVFLTTGISYSLPLKKDHSLSLAPEIYYSYSLNRIVDNRNWNINALRFGLALIYNTKWSGIEKVDSIKNSENPNYKDTAYVSQISSDKDENTDSADIHDSSYVNINVVGVSNNIELTDSKFKVEEFQSLNMTPILNYVFFDNNSSRIPERYNLLTNENTVDFQPTKLVNSNTLETYYNLLNIIGYRMQQSENAKLSITGCNSDAGAERNNRELSSGRAKSVADYLENVWKINPQRIKTVVRNLPTTASRNNVEEGMEENRRVEIESSDPEILKPFISHDTLVVIMPDKIRFFIDLYTGAEFYDWSLFVFQGNTNLLTIEGKDSVPGMIEWKLEKEKYNVPRLNGDVNYWFIARTSEGETVNFRDKLNFDIRNIETKRLNNLEDKRVDNYSLILYQYNSSNLTSENESIADFIRTNLEDNSTIYITGYTDEIGDGEYNMELSEKRARKLKEILSSKAFERGLGKSIQLYDNKLPEGRFYNRTVKVKVETPIN
jgi:outer membrane protein OmpA-like peptidoglycan-associated protein